MEAPPAGAVVLISFPFSDLSRSKLRPAVGLASVSRDDYVLCRVTSNPYADPNAVELTKESFEEGSLQRVSYARPGKLFTANAGLFEDHVGILNEEVRSEIVAEVVTLLRAGKMPSEGE
jgi:mRNA interferase MazF